MTEHALRAGAAESVITPALGTAMSGFGAREHPASAVHDDLRAVALVLDDGTTRIGILACDLVGVSVPVAHAWRRFFAARTGIAASNILLACSHTHSGPATGLLWDASEPGERERAYVEHLKHVLSGALEAAAQRARPARLRLAAGRVRTQANRRDRLDGTRGPVDDGVGVLRLDPLDDDGSAPAGAAPLAVVVHYACHPTGLTAGNTGFSPDYPGWVRRAVGQALGAPCLFLQGACGDLNPASRFGPDAARGTDEQLAAVRDQGVTVGRTAAELAQRADDAARATPGDGVPQGPWLGAATRTLDAPLAPLPTEEDVAARLAALEAELAQSDGVPAAARRTARSQYRWHAAMAELLRSGTGPLALTTPHEATTSAGDSPGTARRIPVEIQALRIGPLAVVALPFEPLSAVGLALRAVRRDTPVWCAGYANGCYGYLPPASEHPRGGYEVDGAHRYYRQPAPVAAEAADRVLEEAALALEHLFGGAGAAGAASASMPVEEV